MNYGYQKGQADFLGKNELFSILQKCNHINTNQVANDSSNIMFNYPSQFKPGSYSYMDQFAKVQRTLLELKGDFMVPYKNNQYPVITSIQFPINYPEYPVIIKIYNPKPEKFRVNDHYTMGVQQDGSIFVALPETSSWSQHKNIGSVMIALQKLLGSHFPFYDKSSAQGQNQNKQPNYNGMQQPLYNNPQGFYNQPNYQPQQNYNPQAQTGYQQPQNRIPSQGTQPIGMNGWDPSPQATRTCQQILDPLAKQVAAEIAQEKLIASQIIDTFAEQESKRQQLEQLSKEIKSSIEQANYLEAEFNTYSAQNDSTVLNKETIDNYLVEQDPLSTQLIDLISEIQAQRETFIMIADLYKGGQGDLEQVMKITRQVAEQQFNSLYLLKKCLKVAK